MSGKFRAGTQIFLIPLGPGTQKSRVHAAELFVFANTPLDPVVYTSWYKFISLHRINVCGKIV